MKINIFLLLLLIVFANYNYHLLEKIKKIKEQIKTYQQNELILSKKIKDIYNEKLLLENAKKTLSKEAKKDTFDWHADISNSYVIKCLQKN